MTFWFKTVITAFLLIKHVCFLLAKQFSRPVHFLDLFWRNLKHCLSVRISLTFCVPQLKCWNLRPFSISACHLNSSDSKLPVCSIFTKTFTILIILVRMLSNFLVNRCWLNVEKCWIHMILRNIHAMFTLIQPLS